MAIVSFVQLISKIWQFVGILLLLSIHSNCFTVTASQFSFKNMLQMLSCKHDASTAYFKATLNRPVMLTNISQCYLKQAMFTADVIMLL